MALAIVVAYNMYLECAEGNICSQWKVDPKKVMEVHTFRARLSTQGLAYSPVCGRYPGVRAMRVFNKLILKDQQRLFQDKHIPRWNVGQPSNVMIRRVKQFKLGKHNGNNSRHFGDFGSLSKHLASLSEPANRVKYGKMCK
jgi:hypothetical protein